MINPSLKPIKENSYLILVPVSYKNKVGRQIILLFSILSLFICDRTMLNEIRLKDGVLSAFEHHCAGSYILPFTGFILIPVQTYAEKVCELEF
jgi:hypothetical protein